MSFFPRHICQQVSSIAGGRLNLFILLSLSYLIIAQVASQDKMLTNSNQVVALTYH